MRAGDDHIDHGGIIRLRFGVHTSLLRGTPAKEPSTPRSTNSAAVGRCFKKTSETTRKESLGFRIARGLL